MGKLIAMFTSRGGVPKTSVNLIDVKFGGILGDDQNDKKNHGGPMKAVCVLENKLLVKLQSEGHPILPGTTGENLLVEGYDLKIGSKFKVGQVELEVVSAATPCRTIAGSFTDGFYNRISHKKFPGETRWYCKVLKEGIIKISD